ncbi:hypothetical protein [Picosynechococcus sp. NKBG15041c]|uniref:hypothetical protein n=1 Tax=Picosynechococcus sp. NKBG15041c TaxID=1407650 RepID=UPI00041B3262|nr:hypothetical protein [Picosynechococcus sp. NKBG15041c]
MAYQGLWEMFKRIILLVVLAFGLWSCGDRLDARLVSNLNPESQPVVTQALTEVATPSLINELRKELDQYQPQVKILSPRPDETFNSSTVNVQLQVNDLPIFKDAELGMGPHVHLFVDDQPYVAVYDTSQPVTLENLAPGSHIVRAFASRPWHESFKNEGAYAETTFNVFTKSNNNIPDFSQPLLTYSRPQGTYGAEPIMLDFYLTNAPLHFVAQADDTDNINDWRIRVTINGESFILDNWQPIYLSGFKKGENWLKLEFIDDQGELLENVYNSPVRVINYDPKLNDTLAKLVQNKLPLRMAKKLVTLKELPPEPAPEIIAPLEEATPEVPAEPEATIPEPAVSPDLNNEESALETEEIPTLTTEETIAPEDNGDVLEKPTDTPELPEKTVPVVTPEAEQTEPLATEEAESEVETPVTPTEVEGLPTEEPAAIAPESPKTPEVTQEEPAASTEAQTPEPATPETPASESETLEE